VYCNDEAAKVYSDGTALHSVCDVCYDKKLHADINITEDSVQTTTRPERPGNGVCKRCQAQVQIWYFSRSSQDWRCQSCYNREKEVAKRAAELIIDSNGTLRKPRMSFMARRSSGPDYAEENDLLLKLRDTEKHTWEYIRAYFMGRGTTSSINTWRKRYQQLLQQRAIEPKQTRASDVIST
jgi:hypothetical protein